MRVRPTPCFAALVALAAPAAAQVDAATDKAEIRAELVRLRQQMDALQKRLDAMDAAGRAEAAAPVAGETVQAMPAPAAVAAAPVGKVARETRIGWKGSPLFEQGDDAAFKVKGRIQYDAGYLAMPAGVSDKATGYSNELRRLRLGAEGKLGAGFGYKLELELSDNESDLVDTYISYETGNARFMLGNHNSFQSLDELIGDTGGSVMERAAFTDAFNFERRLGFSAQYHHGAWLAQAGIFSDDAAALANSSDGPEGGDENDSFSLDGRLVFAPLVGKTQLHFGGSYHWRDLNRLSETPQRYRQRPYLHSVNSRYLATPAIATTGETHYGIELAGATGPWHVAGEAHWLRALRPGLADPVFFGAYAEVGLYLTRGDTRPYADGIFGTAKPKRPLSAGGPGAIQINLRYDHLDLDDLEIVGGKQDAIIAGLIWTPIQYLRFNVNYAHLSYADAAIATAGDRNYGADAVALRAELDF